MSKPTVETLKNNFPTRLRKGERLISNSWFFALRTAPCQTQELYGRKWSNMCATNIDELGQTPQKTDWTNKNQYENQKKTHQNTPARPLYEGDYPELMRQRLGERLPRFAERERELLRGSNEARCGKEGEQLHDQWVVYAVWFKKELKSDCSEVMSFCFCFFFLLHIKQNYIRKYINTLMRVGFVCM